MTLPTAEAKGFSAKRTWLSYLPGVLGNYCTDVQILGGIHDVTDDRECFTWQRIAC